MIIRCILTSVDSDEPVQPLFKLRNSKRFSVNSFTLIRIFKRLAKALIRLRISAYRYCTLLVAHHPNFEKKRSFKVPFSLCFIFLQLIFVKMCFYQHSNTYIGFMKTNNGPPAVRYLDGNSIFIVRELTINYYQTKSKYEL